MRSRASGTPTLGIAIGLALAAIACCASPLAAQTITIPRSVVGSGGGTATGGTFTLKGTIAEATAGATLTAGSFTVINGFWSARIAAPFTDTPLLSGVTVVRAVHVTQLRARIDALRAQHGLGAMSWTNPTLTPGVSPVTAIHVSELRAAIVAVYAHLSLAAPVFDDAVLTLAVTPIKASHLTQLRVAVASLEER